MARERRASKGDTTRDVRRRSTRAVDEGNKSFSNTWNMYKDASKCAAEGVAKGTAEGDPMYGSWAPAAECGRKRPRGSFDGQLHARSGEDVLINSRTIVWRG
jgi:hypothetical protein